MSDRPPLSGTVLITGASAGIGRAIARRVCAEARHVILVARRTERLETLADELRQVRAGVEVDVITCDLAAPTDVEALCDRLIEQGGVDVLVNNAGFGDRASLEEADVTKLQRMIAVNVSAVVVLTRRLVAGMVERGHGGVLNIGSVLGHITQPGVATYAGTKHFIAGFSDALRAEVASAGVTVTEVCPGPVATEFRAVAGGGGSPDALRIDAGQCAEEALRGFRRGRAVVYPGRAVRWMMRLVRLLPQCVLRWLMARSGERSRVRSIGRA